MKQQIRFIIAIGLALSAHHAKAQTWKQYVSVEGKTWQEGKVRLSKRVSGSVDLTVNNDSAGSVFRGWGTCFNELGWEALQLLDTTQQHSILDGLFSPAGDLRFTLGRFSMNANDYARSWYSCDEVPGDFKLQYFNIERDKQALIPYIKEAQSRNPAMTFWISPWSPPSWMKINQYYAIRSDKDFNNMLQASDIALYENQNEKQDRLFPQRLAVNDYMIQDPRYLEAYARYFCRFIDAYKQEGIPVTKVMYQNEAYSYTVYPGCAWTPEGTIRFNAEYLAPALSAQHPEVELYLGTINTNRYALIDSILSDPRMTGKIRGIGFQWEGGQLLPALRKKYPHYTYVQTESECGWGAFDWKAAEHTFKLINYYLGNGCVEYTFWNAILMSDGMSPWGWKQNALISVDSVKKTYTCTPEYFAVKHYTRFVTPGSTLLAAKEAGADGKPVLVFLTQEGKKVIIAGNLKDKPQVLTVHLREGLITALLPPHSFHTFESKTTSD